jgi:mono/diheme cytochrome c family protein
MMKRVLILFGALAVVAAFIGLISFDVVKFDFISFMEIQPVYSKMENPLPVPERSIPVEGAAYIAGLGAPDNPIEADDVSIERGEILFQINCSHCHGTTGEGNGPVAPFLANKKPANLTLDVTQQKSDGTLFLTISNGIPDTMPALNENLTVRERWDVVNFIRTLAP